ncbi:MAG: IS4 family transposase [Bacteroidales bacterium]|nr:IS4 family transposase [Bacteroidales bacterium]
MEIFHHTDLWRRSVVSDRAFTRKRSLPFSTLVLMILNLPKRSLNIEINSFFNYINQKCCGKSAFCMQRSKLKPFFFVAWNRVLITSFYRHYKERVKRWNGFILLAFDGSVFSLPNTEELRTTYGQTSSNRGKHGAAAYGCLMYDVLNKLVVDARLISYFSRERSVVMEQLKHAPANSLLTFDRGYPGYWLFYLLLQKQHKFVMRARLDLNNVVKDFVKSSEQDCIKVFHPGHDAIVQMKQMGIKITKETAIYLRLIKLPLKTGETEVLITNLYSSECFSIKDLKDVYKLRWGIETCFGVLKNQLQIENFSGIRRICIEQDFFANLFVYNLQSIIEKQCQFVVTEISNNRKYNYQINKNVCWAFLKNRIVDLFLKENQQQILLELQTLFKQHLEPIRPHRTYPRIRKAIYGNGKYITLKNYKHAI